MKKNANTLYHATIYGQAVSKANSRRMVYNKKTKKPMYIKSEKAMAYVDSFIKQTDEFRWSGPPYECKLILHCDMYYESERPDLDESLVMDCLQKADIIKNDRLIREKHIYHFIDKKNPRVEIKLEERK